MPFLSDTEVNERVNSDNNLVNRLTIHEIDRGRGMEVPKEIKKIVAILGNEPGGGSCRELAKAFDINRNTVNHAERGITKHEDVKQVVEKAKSEVDQNRTTAESKAVSALLTSLDLIPDAISSNPKRAKQISTVAKDMAMISNMMGNKGDMDGKGERAMHLHLYAPRQKKVEDYEIIDVAAEVK